MSRLSYLIHRLCARRGMQLGELAQRMDVRRTSLSQLLAKDKPKPSTFRKLASALGLDPQMLIDAYSDESYCKELFKFNDKPQKPNMPPIKTVNNNPRQTPIQWTTTYSTNMFENKVNLTESELRKIVAESVDRVLENYGYIPQYCYNDGSTDYSELDLYDEASFPLSLLLTEITCDLYACDSSNQEREKDIKSYTNEFKEALAWARAEGQKRGIVIDIAKCMEEAVKLSFKVFQDDFSNAQTEVKKILRQLGEKI